MKRIVCFSGYLLKKQKNAGGKVQRWFVFAPPFLLCYDDAKTAANDFSSLRCLPHNANRGMVLDKDTKITVNTQGGANNLGFDQIEFAVMTEEKTWYLQAGSFVKFVLYCINFCFKNSKQGWFTSMGVRFRHICEERTTNRFEWKLWKGKFNRKWKRFPCFFKTQSGK